jgi:hypothetical protein
MKRVHRGLSSAAGIAALAAISLGVHAPALAAQAEGGPRQTWRLEGVRRGYCVRFLVDPSAAADLLPKGAVAVPASEDPTLHPALQRAIQDQPETAGWSPAELCLAFVQTVDVDGRRFAMKDGEPPQALGLLGIRTRGADSGQGTAIRLLSDNWRVGEWAKRSWLDIDIFDVTSGKVPESTDDRIQMKVGKTTLVWDGRAATDSAAVEQPLATTWSVAGMKQTHWTVAWSLQPESRRSLVGTLTVLGKDALARALKGSPIRFVGPLYTGGSGEIVFTR